MNSAASTRMAPRTIRWAPGTSALIEARSQLSSGTMQKRAEDRAVDRADAADERDERELDADIGQREQRRRVDDADIHRIHARRRCR